MRGRHPASTAEEAPNPAEHQPTLNEEEQFSYQPPSLTKPHRAFLQGSDAPAGMDRRESGL
jgi:hypothetical protein